MQVPIWFVVLWLALEWVGAVTNVAWIGKQRQPVTRFSAGVAVVTALVLTLLFTLWLS